MKRSQTKESASITDCHQLHLPETVFRLVSIYLCFTQSLQTISHILICTLIDNCMYTYVYTCMYLCIYLFERWHVPLPLPQLQNGLTSHIPPMKGFCGYVAHVVASWDRRKRRHIWVHMYFGESQNSYISHLSRSRPEVWLGLNESLFITLIFLNGFN